MIRDLQILAQASAMARHATARHEVIAENIANADTPGYKARDLPRFDARLAERAGQSEASRERAFQAVAIETTETSPNGNSVSLDDQLVRAAETQGQHQAALSVYRKTLELLRLSVTSRTS